MWDSPRVLNLIALVVAIVAVAAFAVGAAAWASRRPMFLLRSIRIEPMAVADGNGAFRHVNAATIRAQAIPGILATTSGNFFTIDLEAVRRALESVAWVRRAQVRREWPNRLVVLIEEHRVLASWDDGRLVNTFGELFTANPAEAEADVEDDAKRLPELAGPDGSERDVASRYVDFRSWFARLSLVPDEVTLSPRYAWTVHFRNGTANGLTVDLGRERDGNTVPERVLRMMNAWSELVALWPKPTLVDLRYPNGFALRAEGLRLAEPARAAAARAVPDRKPAAKSPAPPKTRPVNNEAKATR